MTESHVKKPGSAGDPLWYKDAILYELHVRAFADSNNDGIGDFPGLMGKLDYLQDLGVTCLWLLPFFPSPLRDDGYDIADYMSVHPDYGTLADFRAFLDAAHARGLQVMIELVVNHTSDQHPWFKAARAAAPGSPEREFYVWNDNDQKYKDARIIFTDTEKSNWTYDPVAKAYFWHRFFSHQPDLNYDNPQVLEEVLQVMRFWLDMGVDGLRMDAIPYLVERDGTNCENLPETHAIMKKIRAAIDADYSDRLILAEANQWPSDVRPYFGDGDECHMAFHFPLMPRIYMALRQEDRLPVTEIMAQTPDIPESCQWGLFLRNHDELTLEMVTEEERDYMYLAYSADPRMRINIGIRRRLAPLLDNNRRRIELLNSLLLSFPGTPILYYGDEIGMGDNIYLGDRNGVRTPMQWSADRNAGFSRAVPAKLYSPVIMDPIYGYQGLNVEAQLSDPSSLLHWMRNMIALRKLFQVFGRGTLEFLSTTNRKVLAYVRRLDGQSVLCVANLSRFAQPVTLDLREFAGMVPVEMLGYVSFPVIDETAYAITLSPYAFLWLELQPAPPEGSASGMKAGKLPESVLAAAASAPEEARLALAENGLEGVLSGAGLQMLQDLLPGYLLRQRWFGAKSRRVVSARVVDHAALKSPDAALVIVEVGYAEGPNDLYSVPLAASFGEAAQKLREESPSTLLAEVVSPLGDGVVHDALDREDVCLELLGLIADEGVLQGAAGKVQGCPSSLFSSSDASNALRGSVSLKSLSPRRSKAEQSNTSILFGDSLILKMVRRLEDGENPDAEIGRWLTEMKHFDRIAPFYGTLTRRADSGAETTLGLLQRMVQNQGDGWAWTLNALKNYYERCAKEAAAGSLSLLASGVSANGAAAGAAVDAAWLAERAADDLRDAELLGRRTGELHVALATPADAAAFNAEAMTSAHAASLADAVREQARQALAALKANFPSLGDDVAEMAAQVLGGRTAMLQRVDRLLAQPDTVYGSLIRIHGDYHLGQVLRVDGDYVILDFEGEPARSLADRRRKQSPLKDVAGMLRSYSYAAFAGVLAFEETRVRESRGESKGGGRDSAAAEAAGLRNCARAWEKGMREAFLRGYWKAAGSAKIVPEDPKEAQRLLNAYLLEKAMYELLYELNNRPAWAQIPLAGILELAG
ncbi:MAG: maltose alpha-D-glucosyltransferase [Acidobacteriaceae bacterium]